MMTSHGMALKLVSLTQQALALAMEINLLSAQLANSTKADAANISNLETDLERAEEMRQEHLLSQHLMRLSKVP